METLFNELHVGDYQLSSEFLFLRPKLFRVFDTWSIVLYSDTPLPPDQHPMPVEPVCASFNSLRADMVSLYELRTLLHNYVYELETIKLQHPGGPEVGEYD